MTLNIEFLEKLNGFVVFSLLISLWSAVTWNIEWAVYHKEHVFQFYLKVGALKLADKEWKLRRPVW